jgi:integrase
MAKALTDAAIKAAKPKDVRYEIRDLARPGLYLCVHPSGARSWTFRFRSPVTFKSTKLTIGSLKTYPLGDARKKATAAMRAVDDGKDPAQDKQQAKIDAIHNAAQAAERDVTALLDAYLVSYRKQRHKPRTIAEVERHVEQRVKPAWRNRTIDSIRKRDVIALLDAASKDGPVLANRLFATVRRFFNFQVARDALSISPAAGIELEHKETPRERVLTDHEIKLVWAATDIDLPFAAFVRTLLLTGQRRGEVAGMRWSEIDLKSKMWTVPAARVKNGRVHQVPLPDLALSCLQRDEEDDCDVVFRSGTKTPISAFSDGKALIDEEILSIARKHALDRGENPEKIKVIDPWTLHDLRRTVSTKMAETGVMPHVIEAVLNHVSGHKAGVAGIYNRATYDVEKKAALERWAAHLLTLVGDEPASSNVVPLARAAS